MVDSSQLVWHPDTGTTNHMTATQGNLHNLTEYYSPNGVMIGNGKIMSITHVGETIIGLSKKPIFLKNVLAIPNIKKNPVSISQLTFYYPLSFEFNRNGFLIKDRTTQRIMVMGKNQKGLYTFDDDFNSKCDNVTYFSSRFQATNRECWHTRLEHPNHQIQDYLKNEHLIVQHPSFQSTNICTSYQLGKASRLPLLSREQSVATHFNKIYCDLWGPAPFPSRDKFKFYAIFIDEFTNFTWLIPPR